ncbi:jg25762 [Pararge aegeria aegeria]|uniref:Microsomal glutathione S-transferase 1 n=4 Tax=Pararge aegeria TaxID=116150 RepID=A0A8S4R752_9NEOP|nr:jg25762 [Pararge aegeria aegeria]
MSQATRCQLVTPRARSDIKKPITEINMVPMSLIQPAVRSYIVYSSILALKVLGMSVLTGIVRHKKKVFANEEDAKPTRGVVKYDDPDVERVRRAHLNDLENIPAFWLLGALYLTTEPSAALATLLFRVYAAGRIAHTLVYAVKPLPQPARGIAYGIPYLINLFMGVKIVFHYISAL